MKKILILKGLPASSKTTFAKELIDQNPGQYKRTNKDDIRALLDNEKWSKHNEKFVLKVRDFIIREALMDGKSVIVDDTNMENKHIERIKEIAKEFDNVFVEEKFFEIDVEEAIKRDKKREKSVGEKVIRDMYNKYLKPKREEYKFQKGLKPAIIVDIDGTIAHNNGHRGWYEYDKVGNDKVIKPVLDIIERYQISHDIIFVSGREDSCRKETKEWFAENNIPWCALYMRKSGDTRCDTIVKREIFNDNIKDKFNVLFVLDDRPRVCRMWHQLGLTLLKVGDPDADF